MSELHVDLYANDWFAAGGPSLRFLRRIAPDDPMLVKADGTPTQLAEGSATYVTASEPHTMADCKEPR